MLRKEYFDVLRGYGALLPPRLFTFPTDVQWSDLHTFIIDSILLNRHFETYPPAREYQRSFWKYAIEYLENYAGDRNEEDEIDDRIYDRYMSLLSQSAPSDTVSPSPSYTTQFWSTEPSYLTRHIIDPTIFKKATLAESRAFVERGTTGLRTWPASLALAEYVLAHKDTVSGKHVLELGSGAGFLGIILASIQVLHNNRSSSLHLSDVNEEVLSRCRENVALPCNISSRHGNVHYHALDWSNSRDPVLRPSLKELLADTGAELILGADLVFDPDLTPSLVETIDLALQGRAGSVVPAATAIIALTVRSERTYEAFERLAAQMFTMQQLQTPELSMFVGLPEGKETPNEITRNVKIIQFWRKAKT